MLELAKCLKLVAPSSMNAEAQMVWLQAAADALEGITVAEVQSVSLELRRSVKHHNQIVPTIADLVAKKRARSTISTSPSPYQAERWIDEEARKRRAAAHGSAVKLDEAYEWERQERLKVGLAVVDRQTPLSRYELDKMRPDIVRMGINSGFLKRVNGQLVEVTDAHETDRIRAANRLAVGSS